ncbi:MAG TPA: flippase [Nitrospirae bacterium]|nr:flippase [Nitrospirota bacterium]
MYSEIKVKTIAKNSLYNIAGFVLPIISALVAIPFIIKGFGVERFGFLTLSWAIVGYFNLFDFGISRALTFYISSAISKKDLKEIKYIVCTAIAMMLFFGLIGGIILFLLSKLIIFDLLNISTNLQVEFQDSIKILSLIIPMVIISTALKGVLEAYQCFFQSNIIQTFIGIGNFLSPLFILFFSTSMTYIVIAMIIIRLIALFMYFIVLGRLIPDIFREFQVKGPYIKVLLSYGGWIFISSVVGPVMVYFDRFFIASVISVSEATYYTTPFEIVTKVTIISVAISSALFPFLTSSMIQDKAKAITAFDRVIGYVFLITFPIMLLIISFSNIFLSLWINKDFADKSSEVLQWLSIGVFLNCIAFIPLSFIHALKRPDITAKIHLVELPFYILILVVLTNEFGIKGSAITWTLRTGIDGLIMFYMSYKLMNETLSVIIKNGAIIIMSLLFSLVGLISFNQSEILYFNAFLFFIYLIISWKLILTDTKIQR